MSLNEYIFKSLDSNIPKHVALIMDGNGRWATLRGLDRSKGHQEGVKRISDVVRTVDKIGVKAITIFAFSTENWSRPQKEIDEIFALVRKYLKEERFNEDNVKITFMGDHSILDEDTRKTIQEVREKTNGNTGTILNIALNYGSKEEILNAIKTISKDYKNGKIDIEELDYNRVENHLMSKGLPDIDLMVRTGGEKRLSNFLLWQLAYSELHFTPVYWPDYNELEFINSIKEYQKREKRFGGLKL